MFLTPAVRKIARLALPTVAAGAGAVLLLLGAPAEAATAAIRFSRGV